MNRDVGMATIDYVCTHTALSVESRPVQLLVSVGLARVKDIDLFYLTQFLDFNVRIYSHATTPAPCVCGWLARRPSWPPRRTKLCA
jgi:hypothetical protein